MQSRPRYFDFHGLLSMSLEQKKKSFFDRIGSAYSFFESEKIVKGPSLSVTVGGFKPDKNDCINLDTRMFFVKDGYIFSSDSYKLASWNFEVAGLDSEQTKLNVDCNSFGHFFYPAYLVDFLLNLKLNLSGNPVIHAAAVEKDGNAFLFAARGGVGKTLMTLNLVNSGFGFLGDNWSILGGRETFCFPYPLNIFYYNVEAIRDRLDRKTLNILSAKKFLYQLSGGYAKIFTPVPSHKLFSKELVEKAKTRALFFMVQGKHFGITECNDRERITRLLVLNNRLEAIPFSRYLLAYSFAFPESKVAKHWEILEKNLSKNLSRADFFSVTVPKRFSPGFATMVSRFLGENI